jgi:pimeloyl-ACP methyl ester carboxylesterase
MRDRKTFGWRAAGLTAALLSLAGCGGGGSNGGGGFFPVTVAPPPAADNGAAPPAPAPAPAPVTAQQACTSLEGKTVGAATVTAAAVVAASGEVPAYCKVNARIDPKLNFELRLPDAWNSKLQYFGGGGYNGSIPPLVAGDLLSLPAIKKGFATVGSDSGHQASGLDASWALNDPTAAQLFGSLSVPTVMSSVVEMLKVAYGTAPAKSYFEGCSNGGREALMTAQRYPNLFDGIIARAPAYNWVGFMGGFNRTAKAMSAPGGSLDAAKVATLAKAVRDACDADDGIVDGVVSNPAACTFDPQVLRCVGGADTGSNCLSDAQLASVASTTSAAVFAGSPTYRDPGRPLAGNEDDPAAFGLWTTGGGNPQMSLQYLFQDTTVKTYLARNLAADSLAYTWDQDTGALYGLAALNDATNVDLRPFQNSGGKLILWHGENDAALSYRTTTEYYTNMVAAVGGQGTADTFTRLYLAPGVNHCAGGPGADVSDLLGALDAWADKGTAPGTLEASKIVAGANAFSRPLCQFPRYPRYTGPSNDAEAAKLASNYTCTST